MWYHTPQQVDSEIAMSDSIQFIRTLRRMPRFGELTEETQRTIAAAAIHRQFGSGQVIFLEGEPANCIYVLESGWVKASRVTREGREQALMFFRPVEVFGDIASLTGAAYPGTAVALEPVTAWAIPAKTILDAIPCRPDLATAIIRHLGERILHYVNLVEDLSLRSVEARVANVLLRNAEMHDQQLIVPRRDWTTFDQMAARLGTVRDVLSRALKTLEAEQLLRVERQSIVILDPKGLADRANR